MMYLGMIITAVVIGLVGGLMNPEPPKKEWKPKKGHRTSRRNDDLFFGTPLEEF